MALSLALLDISPPLRDEKATPVAIKEGKKGKLFL
jgi:hypothetical protein